MPGAGDRAVGGRDGWLSFRRPLILLVSCLLATASYLIAFYLRFDSPFPTQRVYEAILRSLPFLLIARFFAFRHYGLFTGWWARTGMYDLLDIIKAVAVGSALFVTSVVLAFGVYAVPRSIVLIDAVILVGLLSGSRLLTRWWGRFRNQRRSQRALVVGALPSMEPVLREILENPEIPIEPIALVDLSRDRAGFRVHGLPILGGADAIPAALASLRIDTILLVLSTREGGTVRQILSRCDGAPVTFKIVPPLHQIMNERLHLSDLRDVAVDDLLGRDEVRVDPVGLRDCLHGRRILITGAAGSIGSELARQVASHEPERLVLLDRNESALAALHAELAGRHGTVALDPRLCDIRNRDRIGELFRELRPHVVYHAAAYKHVPMMEVNPVEALKNNVLGTRDLLVASDQSGVERFVLISTDKAVHPVNIMGSTKRVAERILEGAEGSPCRRIAVRFGNVFGSEGSVVPILMRQIRDGGPVTITHPDATRYFMTIPEAVLLVLQASALGQGGEIFVLEMGEPVRILDLATSLIRLAGLQPGRDIEVRITGLRPGERLHEETLIDSESRPTGYPKLWVRPMASSSGPILEEIARVEEWVHANDQDAILGWIRRICDTPGATVQ